VRGGKLICVVIGDRWKDGRTVSLMYTPVFSAKLGS